MAGLWQWAEVRAWGKRRRAQLEAFLEAFVVVHSTLELCRSWGGAMTVARLRGLPILSSDAWVAATALSLSIPLVSNNAADYRGLPDLQLISR